MVIDWQLISNGLTGISTLAMAVIAFKALNTWKDEQKRSKLFFLLESLNKYIQELQYYELESTIFSKKARNSEQEDYENDELILKQSKYIDLELAEEFGLCILCMKNWLIDHENQKEKLDNICKIMQYYRVQIFDYVSLKINFYVEKNKDCNKLYGMDKNLLDKICSNKKEIENIRNKLVKEIDEFKQMNKKLLK